MEFICDLILSPIFWFLLAKLNERLPSQVSLFLKSFLLAAITAPLGWLLLLYVGPNDRDLDQAFQQANMSIPIIFIVVLLSTFFGGSYLQNRHKKHFNQDQFIVAKDLIRGRKYQKALDILATIDDPQARDLEDKVYDMAFHDPDFLRRLKQ
ncbi:MAG: hypothetical protein GC179_16210 [Anaerolineaceae bacterium]|nr:hypothetical protein [Anaerolineaceae bacterium]